MKIDMVCEESFYDSYAFEFGIRSISWSKTSSDNSNAWLINSEPFYCHGVNRHEDFPVKYNNLLRLFLIKFNRKGITSILKIAFNI